LGWAPLWLALAFALSATRAFCGTIAGPIIRPDTGHAYYLLAFNNWTASEAEAITLGGHLVTINNADENQWVYDTFIPLAGSHDPIFQGRVELWIGLTDANEEGVFTWASGEPISYTHWDVMQPNNAFQDYVQIRGPISRFTATSHPGFWNDFNDVATTVDPYVGYFGVVEIIPEPSSLHLIVAGLLGSSIWVQFSPAQRRPGQPG
jgi:hypothetical protein